MASIDRRTFLARGAAAVGSVALAGPLQAHAARAQAGSPTRTEGYGPLVPAGDLMLPAGFSARVVSRQGDPMSDGNPTPGIFDGMGAFAGPDGTTILMRNHENRSPFFPGFQDEMPVQVPADKRYDNFLGEEIFKGGVTKVVLGRDLVVRESFAVLGGTTTNCAGGTTPWGSWITCEEVITPFPSATTRIPAGTPLPLPDLSLALPHGYIYEIDSRTAGPVGAIPVKSAGRFFHEAVAWHDGVLYETEDNDVTNPQDAVAFYRYVPDSQPTKAGDLAAADSGRLQALRIAGEPNRDLRTGTTVGEALPVEWVTIADPDPATDTVRQEAFNHGAARFTREEGIWVGDGRIYFDASNGGNAGQGQLFEHDPAASTIRLVYESPEAGELKGPDNLVVAPFGDVFICEDEAIQPLFVRGITPDGLIYDFAHSVTNPTEFCGACFSPDGRTLFVNQQGGRGAGAPQSVTYAITGPFESRAGLVQEPAPGSEPDRDRRRGRRRDGGRDGRERQRQRGHDGDGGRSGGDGDGGDEDDVRSLGAGAGAAGAASAGGGLPFTGLPLHLTGGAGALLAGLGVVLRRRMRAAERGEADETVD